MAMNRREFLITAASTMFAAAACSRSHTSNANAKQVNIYSWADYLHPEAIPEFQRRTGIRVVYDTFASNEALLAKVQAGASDYDIIVPTSYMARVLKKMDKLSVLDKERIVG